MRYPFGMMMPGRTFSSGNYRYGFQGQEQDDEVKGTENSVNYKYRMHDPRIGRFFAEDPLAPDYPWNSSYAFSENKLIDSVELEGLESKNVIKEGEKYLGTLYEWGGKNPHKSMIGIKNSDQAEFDKMNAWLKTYYAAYKYMQKEVKSEK